MNIIKLNFLLLIFLIKNIKTDPAQASTNITLTNTDETSEITFSEGQLLIWPENCILNVEYGTNNKNSDRNLISIDSSQTTSVRISVNKTDSGQIDTCRFHYVNYIQSIPISLIDTGTFRFEKYENLSLEFNASEYYIKPVYYLSFNKLGSGSLTFTIHNEIDGNEEIFTITDSDPFKGIYINRNHLFETDIGEGPFKCSITINVTGMNIPFTILISVIHNNTRATYLKPNEMILGIAEAFNPLYFFT